MSQAFVLSTKTRVDTFTDSVSIGDVTQYSIDCSPWAEDNATITSATWAAEYGQVAISNQAIASNVVSARLSFSQSGHSLVSVLIATAGGLTKKIWLELFVKDKQQFADDYGFGT